MEEDKSIGTKLNLLEIKIINKSFAVLTSTTKINQSGFILYPVQTSC